MKKILFKSKYMIGYHSSEEELIEYHWLETSEEMLEEEYKKECLHMTDFILELRPKYVFLNPLHLLFPIAPEIQQWSVDELVPLYIKAGVRKLAILVPEDFFSSLSVFQTVEDAEEVIHGMYEIRHFDNEEAVFEWFKY